MSAPAAHAEYLRDRLERADKTQLPATVLLRELRAQENDRCFTLRGPSFDGLRLRLRDRLVDYV